MAPRQDAASFTVVQADRPPGQPAGLSAGSGRTVLTGGIRDTGSPSNRGDVQLFDHLTTLHPLAPRLPHKQGKSLQDHLRPQLF